MLEIILFLVAGYAVLFGFSMAKISKISDMRIREMMDKEFGVKY